jgi:cytochrome c oxidase subunit II
MTETRTRTRCGCSTIPIPAQGIAAAATCSVLQGCAGFQSALDPAGDVAARISDLFWLFVSIAAVVWLLVVGVMLVSLLRPPEPRDLLVQEPRQERAMGVTVTAATATTAVILIALTLLSFYATRGLGAPPQNALQLSVTGNQWWWEVEYLDQNPSNRFTTANEIHVPVGRPVSITLHSRDVIHSFWVPNLAGKMDLIPGRTNTVAFTAMRAGVFRGQCAEYCGLQHAQMALIVVAESPEVFASWRSQQSDDAVTPTVPNAQNGQQVFLRSGCAGCHTVRGTGASGMAGPDLTHIAGRRTIAAGALANTRSTLQAWIADPQGVKPGAKMPRLELTAPELNAVSDYLSGLQ